MKTHPLSLIDEENEDDIQKPSYKIKYIKSLNEDDSSTENTYKTQKKNKKIIFDLKTKINDKEKKDDNISNNLINKKEKRFSYHGKVYYFIAWVMLFYQYLSYIYLIELPIISNQDFNFLYFLRIIFFHILIILLACSLYMTSKIKPGTTPLYWGFHIGDEDFKKKRYCLICQVFKPERTHHCSICNLCVLNMDHHCPWVDNCIGFYNKKFFIQLLCYFLIASISLCITYIPYSYDIIKEFIKELYKINKKEIYNEYNYIFLGNNIILLCLSIIVFNFMKFHFYLMYYNLTTIETLDNDLKENKKYDMGFANNFKQIFGENKLLWFLPINSPLGYPVGDGLTWPTKFDLIPLDNLNNELSNENTIENFNNVIDDKIININVNTKENKNVGNNSQTRASSALDNSLSVQRFSSNFSKYNTVKRNQGNYNNDVTETNSTKRTNCKINDD